LFELTWIVVVCVRVCFHVNCGMCNIEFQVLEHVSTWRTLCWKTYCWWHKEDSTWCWFAFNSFLYRSNLFQVRLPFSSLNWMIICYLPREML